MEETIDTIINMIVSTAHPLPSPPPPQAPLSLSNSSLCFLVFQKLNTEQSVSVPRQLSLSAVHDPWLRGTSWHSPALQATLVSLGSAPSKQGAA